MTASYTPPVDRLLGYGEWKVRRDSWADYLTIGLTPEHVPELIRMATDEELWAGPETASASWAPLHAWRALGQLRAEAAAEPLTEWLVLEIDADRVMAEIPVVLGMIGRPSIAPAGALLADPAEDLFARWAAARTLGEVANRHPDARGEAVAELTAALSRWSGQDPVLNAVLISQLVDLGATDAAPLMESAFEAGEVDLEIQGDWEDVQVRLGLIPNRTPLIVYVPPLVNLTPPSPARRPARSRTQLKARRKAATKARRRNRRK
jgi:hypothetical protein